MIVRKQYRKQKTLSSINIIRPNNETRGYIANNTNTKVWFNIRGLKQRSEATKVKRVGTS